jgi:hypothetical protein
MTTKQRQVEEGHSIQVDGRSGAAAYEDGHLHGGAGSVRPSGEQRMWGHCFHEQQQRCTCLYLIPEPAKLTLSNSINLLTTSPWSSSTTRTNFLLLMYSSIFWYSASPRCHRVLTPSSRSTSSTTRAARSSRPLMSRSSLSIASCLLFFTTLSAVLLANSCSVRVRKGPISSIPALTLLYSSLRSK